MTTNTKTFTVDAKTIIALGRNNVKDHTTAIIELVKNSYDADATYVEVEIMTDVPEPYIRIADNGTGMSEEDIDNHWLRIGYSGKTVEKVSKKNRRKTGEKGIGRISADRLGSVLEMYTGKTKESTMYLRVDWNDFDIANRTLSDIQIEFEINSKGSFPNNDSTNSGTEIIIKELRQTWTDEDIEKLYQELSTFISPFKQVNDFKIYVKSNLSGGIAEFVGSELFDNFELRIDAEYDGYSSFITYQLLGKENISIDTHQRELLHLKLDAPTAQNIQNGLGPISVSLLFYLRTSKTIEGTGFQLKDLREFLDNQGGIKIYRDNIWVKPYGDLNMPEGDWVGLEKRYGRTQAGAGRPDFRIRPNQLVGAVFIKRDLNPTLSDSAGREGLIQNQEFKSLQALIEGIVQILEVKYHEKFTSEETENSSDIKTFNDNLKELKQELQNFSEPSQFNLNSPEARAEQIEKAGQIARQIPQVEKSIEKLVSEMTILRGLATIGISSAVFGHETATSLSNLQGEVSNALDSLKIPPPDIQMAISALDSAEKHVQKISAWGAFSLDRIRRDKRKNTVINIKEITEEVLKSLEPVFKSMQIQVITNLESIKTKTFAMDIEAVLLNLLTNAYHACKQQPNHRVIKIELKTKKEAVNGFEFIIADSGPGINPDFFHQIWTPLFTTKKKKIGNSQEPKTGTGLGLKIVQSIVEDLKGTRSVKNDIDLKGAQFRIWFPIVK